ncbi:hypothetical protein MARPU_04695 [Marichromatium purpuratum 984]|uniref:Uncharacterized protein n=1 Tax=Marichromatium purpuratum 984 TaxID=765910 RepID=W0DXE5_MARPU|nr:DinB family protein [Marichromatium purpuratum]AHF03260.1 hypothetical protein MARPU_04695 [Marichromatium purpuratum 984]
MAERDATDANRYQLPAHERLMVDLGMRAYVAFASPATVLRLFRAEAEQACAIAARLDEQQGRCAARVRRVIGLEPGGRDWSVYMVLDHLVMVNAAITALVHALCVTHGQRIEIGHADVTPHVDAGPDRIDALRASVERHAEVIERLGPLNAHAVYPHPWFGPLDARQWHALAALHNRTHRVQLQRIARRFD